MSTPFISIVLFFTTTSLGKWLKQKAFTLLAIVLFGAAAAYAYGALVKRVELTERTKLTVQVQADKITELAQAIEKLDAANAHTQTTLANLRQAQVAFVEKAKVRNQAVEQKTQAITRSALPAKEKEKLISSVYAETLQQAYCAAEPAACTNAQPETLK